MRIIKVIIWNQLAGLCHIDDQNHLTFEYADTFVNTGLELSPLHMPLSNKVYQFNALNEETFKGLPGMIADSLPDRWGNSVLKQWAEANNKELGVLQQLGYIGKRGIGALEYEPAFGEAKHTDRFDLEMSEIVKIANNIVQARKEFSSSLSDIEKLLTISSSAGGARAKAVVGIHDETNKICSGQIDLPDDYSHWLIKFDGVTNDQLGDPKEYGKIEYCYSRMAKDAGIDFMPTKILNEGGRSHFLTKRFDRIGNEKLHQQTLCGLAHMDYNQPGLHSYEDAFRVLNALKLEYKDREQLYRRACFNVLGANHDDHTKNISFLMNREGEWKLSPAYDLTYSYNPDGFYTSRHQMSINGKVSDISIKDLIALAKKVNVKQPNKIIDQVREGVNNWQRYAKEHDISQKRINSVQKMIDSSYIDEV